MPKWKGLKLERLKRELHGQGHRPSDCKRCLQLRANWFLYDEAAEPNDFCRGQCAMYAQG